MGDMTDVFNGVVNITGNLLDSDFVNRFTMATFCSDTCIWNPELRVWIPPAPLLDDDRRFLCRCGTGAYCCTYNGNAGEIHDADRSFGNRCCVCGNRIFDL